MPSNKSDKLGRSIAISVLLHTLLLGLLIIGYLWYSYTPVMGGGEGNGDVMGVVMVDTRQDSREFGRIKQQYKGDFDKVKQVKADAYENQQEKIAKDKAKFEAVVKDTQEKAKAEVAAKAAKAKASQQAALDDLINNGTIGGGSSTRGSNQNSNGSSGIGAGKGRGDGDKVGDQYAGVIKRVIQRRFIRDPSFAGKVCTVRIMLSRDGTITGYDSVSGPNDICNAALRAIKATRKVPAAPSDKVYKKYRNPTIAFDLK